MTSDEIDKYASNLTQVLHLEGQGIMPVTEGLLAHALRTVISDAYEEAAQTSEETKRTKWASGAYETRQAVDECVKAIRALKPSSEPGSQPTS